MSTIQTVVVIVSSIIAILIIYFYVLQDYRYDHFQRNMREGDLVYFYVNEERIVSKIVEMKENEVVMLSVLGEKSLIWAHKKDLYPLIGEKY